MEDKKLVALLQELCLLATQAPRVNASISVAFNSSTSYLHACFYKTGWEPNKEPDVVISEALKFELPNEESPLVRVENSINRIKLIMNDN